MPKIIQLSPHVADLIAAGEVVERPASVVKELVENAVDAGSRRITVEIQNGGMTLLRITDDGCGMEPEDAETAFLRHATSKIRDAADLESIHTLGFRGEALAATAAVSRVELLTKTPGSATGISLQLEGGKLLSKKEAGCPDGTTIVVRDLFFNTPARMKFMKRDSVEASAVLGVLQRQALANPGIAFRLLRDGQEELSTAGDGDLHSTIYQIYGRQFAGELTPVSGKWNEYRLEGFATKPTNTRGNRNYQQFFVNGRYVKSRLLSAALEEAYRNQIMVGRFPGCVLMLTVPVEAVDVNVHPAKTEVKFLAEQEVFDCVRYGVQSALGRTPAKPELHLPEKKEAPAATENRPAPKQDFFRTMTPADFKAFSAQLQKTPPVKPAPNVVKAVLAPESPVMEQVQLPMPAPKPTPAPAPAPVPAPKPEPEAAYRMAGELFDTYIIVEQGDEVYFVDKHAAHERILFEKYRAQSHPIMAQTLLTPVTASLTPEEAAAVLENAATLERYGFGLEDFGDGTVLLRQMPADLDPEQGEAVLSALAEDLLEGKRLKPEEAADRMLHTVACKAAIKAGWHTTEQEKAALIREVFSREDLKYCPHGRPICVKLTKTELEKRFGRT